MNSDLKRMLHLSGLKKLTEADITDKNLSTTDNTVTYRLSDDEEHVLNLLTDAYNSFVELPDKHPSDNTEFAHGIHILQRHVMARIARRTNPHIFENKYK